MSEQSGVRRWILAAAVASFTAGVAVGLAGPAIVHAVAADGPLTGDELYVRYLIDQYGLDAKQARQVRMVREARAREKQQVLMREVDQLPEVLRTELAAIDRRAHDRMRFVLTKEQLERFLRDRGLEMDLAGDHPETPEQAKNR